jgi:hypothetical protein
MRGIVKACRRPPGSPLPVRPHDRNGGFPRLSGGVPRGSRCPAPPRHALLAENLGKPSLWVFISAAWYKFPFWLTSEVPAMSEVRPLIP